MDKKCVGCPDRSKSINEFDWCFCLNIEVNRKCGNTGKNYPSCLRAQSYYCNKDYRNAVG
ncbi:MAG: hypothetical protein N3I35_06840 [Clostridia bacterium]|nr:hypothetical protein [Clostridia bacterium]